MADESDNESTGNETSDKQNLAGQQGQSSEYGAQGQQSMGDQGREGSLGGQSSGGSSNFADQSASSESETRRSSQTDGMSGQAIGGNDSNTGSGTTMTQGADFGGQSSSGQTQSDRNNTGTLMADQGPANGSSIGNQAGIRNEDSAEGSSGEGFIGSQGTGSDDYLQKQDASSDANPSSSETMSGSDFAPQGRGALEDDSDEEEDSSSGSSTSSSGSGGSF